MRPTVALWFVVGIELDGSCVVPTIIEVHETERGAQSSIYAKVGAHVVSLEVDLGGMRDSLDRLERLAAPNTPPSGG